MPLKLLFLWTYLIILKNIKTLEMNRLGGVYKDENIVCSTTCEIYIPSSLPGTGQGTSGVKCELHSFGRCDVYLIQSTGRSLTETGSIVDIPGQQKVSDAVNFCCCCRRCLSSVYLHRTTLFE